MHYLPLIVFGLAARVSVLLATAPPSKKPEVVKNLTSEGSASIKDGALSYRGDLSSSGGTIADGDYTDLQTSASFAGRVATIESLSVAAFGGSLKAKGSYDMRESTPRFAASTTVKAMDLTQIFRSMHRRTAKYPGTRQYGSRNHRGRPRMERHSEGPQGTRQSLGDQRSVARF